MGNSGTAPAGGLPAQAGAVLVNESEVAAALELILASEAFAHVERPSRFLRHLVETTLHGQGSTLKESLIGVQVFERDATWDPRADPVVRQEAARLRKRLSRYYEAAKSGVRIELPVGSYVPVFHRVPGVPAAEQEPAPGDSAQSAPDSREDAHYGASPLAAAIVVPRASSRALWFTAGVVVAAVLAVAWPYFRVSFSGAPVSIVVLPFTSLSTEPANEYFAAGLTDEITDELVRLKALKVMARTSALALKGHAADVREVGQRLNASYVLEGSVERSGDEARISAHLERTSDGAQVWSGTYDRRVKDLLTIQSDLAAAIARNLRLSVGATAAQRHVPKEEAHDLYLRAVFDTQTMTPDSIGRAEQELQRATRIDPEYAEAWFALGLAKFNKPASGAFSRTAAETNEVKALYRKALSLDPDLASAHANLGFIAMIDDWDWAGAERELRLASHNGPHAFAETTYALLLGYRGRFREADSRMASAVSLDPANPTVLLYLGGLRYWEGRFPQANAMYQQILERYPDQLGPRIMLNLSYLESGQAGLALTNQRALEKRFPPIRLEEAMALGQLRRREEGLRLIRQLETEYEQNPRVSRQWFALAWASLGDHAQAVKWLERSADLHEFQVLNLAVNPGFAEMRDDPAFRRLVKRIGLI
jgi:TolB-like protein/tetratricopeptide (TPR) repeat protein